MGRSMDWWMMRAGRGAGVVMAASVVLGVLPMAAAPAFAAGDQPAREAEAAASAAVIPAKYRGTWRGTWEASGVTGTFTVTIGPQGNATGTGTAAGFGTFTVHAHISPTGAFTGSASEPNLTVRFSGQAGAGGKNASGSVGARAYGYPVSGTFRARR